MINQRQPPARKITLKAARNEAQLLVVIVFLITYGSVFKQRNKNYILEWTLCFFVINKRQNNLIDLRKQSGCKLTLISSVCC